MYNSKDGLGICLYHDARPRKNCATLDEWKILTFNYKFGVGGYTKIYLKHFKNNIFILQFRASEIFNTTIAQK